MSMHNWLQDVWYGEDSSGLLLRPLSWLFGRLVALRHWLYRRGVLRSEAVGRPVVVVGNLTVGGSGKTPATLWLAGQLRERAVKVGIVMRGYRSGNTRPRLVGRDASYKEVGDEAVLLARRSGAPVAVGADRVAAARLLVGEGVDLIIADDGLQHRALKRDFEIVVIDGERRFGNGRLLPAGPLREPVERLREVDAVVVNGAAGRQGEIAMRLRPGPARAVTGEASQPLSAFAGAEVHAVAAIGNPERFFRLLETLGMRVIRHPFPDHHPLQRADIEFADALAVLMTEKDAVKCEGFAGPRHWYVPVEADIDPAQGARLLDSVLALLAGGARRG
jgi:tetraacyldisaccharide 4'-kinase